MKILISAYFVGLVAVTLVTAYRYCHAQPLPQSAPAPAHVEMSPQMQSGKISFEHPSGMSVTVEMPTNVFTVTAPAGYEVRAVQAKRFTLEAFYELKRTNGSAMVYFLLPKE